MRLPKVILNLCAITLAITTLRCGCSNIGNFGNFGILEIYDESMKFIESILLVLSRVLLTLSALIKQGNLRFSPINVDGGQRVTHSLTRQRVPANDNDICNLREIYFHKHLGP